MKEIFLYCYFSSHSIIYNCTKKNWVLTWILKNVEKCLSSLFKFLKNTRKICKQANKFIHSILKLYRLKKETITTFWNKRLFLHLAGFKFEFDLNFAGIFGKKMHPRTDKFSGWISKLEFDVFHEGKARGGRGSRLASFENCTGARVCYTVKITC